MKKRSFGAQIVISFLLVTVMLFSIIFTIFLYANIQEVKKSVQNELTALTELYSSQLSYIIGNMSFISTYILSNTVFIDAAAQLNTGKLSAATEMTAYRTVQSALINYSLVSSIYRVTFFNENGYIVTSESYNLQYTAHDKIESETWENIEWLPLVQNNHGKAILLSAREQLFSENPKITLMLARAVRNSSGIIGYLTVDVPLENISDTLKYVSKYHASAIILNKEEQLLFSSKNLNNAEFNEDYSNISISDLEARNLHYSTTDLATGITVVIIAPKSVVWQNTSQSVLTFLIEGIIFLVAAVIVIIHISRGMVKPLTLFTNQLEQAKIEDAVLEQPPADNKYAEIDCLYDAYSNMQQRLHAYVEREIAWNTLQTEQKFELLQSQINPHFLYNTLNIIGVMGLEKNNKDVFQACKNLSSILRYAISDKNSYISTINQEMDNVRAYLALMQLRYGEACSYTIQEEETVLSQKIPRLVIQPIVENIFEHAYDRNHEIVHITITVGKKENCWFISVADDGCGMSNEKLETLKSEIETYLSENTETKIRDIHNSMGLKNTLLRLYLFFDGNFVYHLNNNMPGFEVYIQGCWENNNDDIQSTNS